MKLVCKYTGEEVGSGSTVRHFRGGLYKLISVTVPHKPSSTGRVYAESLDGHGRIEVFPSVFDLKWEEREDRS